MPFGLQAPRQSGAATAAATLVAAAFALVVGAFTTPQAVAQTPSAGNSGNFFAVGGFAPADTDMDGITHVAFAAETFKNGTSGSAHGYVVQETSTGVRSGPVTCLDVHVNNTNPTTSSTGTVVWTVKQSNIAGDVIGLARSFEATDNGVPKLGVSPDTFKDRGTSDTTCSPDMNGMTEALLNGNIVVSP